jgi:hypothetical protein
MGHIVRWNLNDNTSSVVIDTNKNFLNIYYMDDTIQNKNSLFSYDVAS